MGLGTVTIIKQNKYIYKFRWIRLHVPIKYIESIELVVNGHLIEKIYSSAFQALNNLYLTEESFIIPFYCCTTDWLPFFDNIKLNFIFTDKTKIFKNEKLVTFTYKKDTTNDSTKVQLEYWDKMYRCRKEFILNQLSGNYKFYPFGNELKGLMFEIDYKTQYWRIENGLKISNGSSMYIYEKEDIRELGRNYYYISFEDKGIELNTESTLIIQDLKMLYVFEKANPKLQLN